MKKKYDVVALGELLIDFTDNGLSGQGNPVFEANPGGAPCNVLAMLRKLGYCAAFIGKVGCDGFGKQLGGTIETTGAGDTFCASVLGFVLENGVENLTEAQLTEMLRFANAAAYLVTTKKGAIRSMPERAAVEAILAR